ncbi:MAG: hypothetical protein AB8G86_28470 [Saprospiraceae bacterium]
MRHSKVFQHIEILSAPEWKDLKKWILSPWANSNKNLIALYKALEKGFPHFQGNKWTKDTIYKKVYPQKIYNNKVFNNLLTDFNKQIKTFLIHERINRQPTLSEHFFTSELMERHATALFEKTTNTFIQNLENKHPKSEMDYWYLYQSNRQLYYQTSARHRLDPESEVLEKAIENLEFFYEWKLLKHKVDERTRLVMLKNQKKDNKPNPKKTIITIQLLKKYLNRPEGWNLKAYQEFKNLYHHHFADLPKEYQKDFLTYCINDSIHPDGLASIADIRQLFEHFKFGLQHHLFFHYEQMTAITFHNILLTASHLEELAFAKQFLSKHISFLAESVQLDARYWGEAELKYMAKDYESAIEKIEEHSFSSPLFKMQSIGLFLRANFERYLEDETYYSTFLSLCQAKEKSFLRSKFLSKSRQLAYIRFIQYLRKLAGIINNPDFGKRDVLLYQKELNRAGNFFGKGWLHKKAYMMINHY